MPAEVKVMTYNVHGCCGKDRKALPSTIAEVIAMNDARIVALQELDVGLLRSGFTDQAHAIAEQLKMNCCFSPSLWVGGGQYGNAVLSAYPLSLRKAEGLPTLDSEGLEPRGIMWVEVIIEKQKVQIFNTHLGLKRKERLLQVDRIVGADWLLHADCRQPVIFCGDLNALPNSSVVRRIRGILTDVQLLGNRRRPKNTYPSRFPLLCLDYIFVSSDIKVKSVSVPRSSFVRRASDHLPLVVEVAI